MLQSWSGSQPHHPTVAVLAPLHSQTCTRLVDLGGAVSFFICDACKSADFMGPADSVSRSQASIASVVR